ncbi:MAG: hypothetical protein WC335_08705 [Candidatus Omnitrophota bacterium]|jgi:hypothetical protein
MAQVFEEKQAQDIKLWMNDQCGQFIRQWMFDLNEEEKQAWLWNSMVAMKKIIMRRKQWSPSA